jgi:hypothetical protein
MDSRSGRKKLVANRSRRPSASDGSNGVRRRQRMARSMESRSSHRRRSKVRAPGMPFKSRAQRRKFAELLVKGKISPETFEERSKGSKRRSKA